MNLMHQINLMQAQGTPPAPAGEEAVHLCWLLHWRRQGEAEVVWFGDQPRQVRRLAAQMESSKQWKEVAVFG